MRERGDSPDAIAPACRARALISPLLCLMTNTVSVLIPVYNAERDLRECLNSVLAQTHRDLRVILIDDGSSDRSPALCDSYAARDKRVEVIHQKNGGAESARVTGIKRLACEDPDGYVAFIDNDDFLPQGAFETLLRAATEEEADIVQGGHRRFFGRHLFGHHIYFGEDNNNAGERGRVIFTEEDLQNPHTLSAYYGCAEPGCLRMGAPWAKLYRNHLLTESLNFERPAKNFQEDVVFNLQMCTIVKKIVMIPEVVYNYRVGGWSTKYKPNDLGDAVRVYDFKRRFIAEHGAMAYAPTIAAELKNEVLGCLISYYNYKRDDEDAVRAEIRRVMALPQVSCAMNTEMPSSVRFPEFVLAMRREDVDAVLAILKIERKKRRKTETAKNLFRKI